MNKNLTELVFILDRSGSMSGLEKDTIGGFNSLIRKQKKEAGQALVSVVLFDDRQEVLYDRVDLRSVIPMNEDQYYVRGCTALLDAIGGAIHHIKKVQKVLDPNEVPEKTLFIITTDGMENSSFRYTYDKVKKMISKAQTKRHWEFLFLGASIDAIGVAGKMGIKPGRAVNFENDEAGTKLNYQVMSDVVSCVRGSASVEAMTEAMDSGELLRPIQDDYKRRHHKDSGPRRYGKTSNRDGRSRASKY